LILPIYRKIKYFSDNLYKWKVRKYKILILQRILPSKILSIGCVSNLPHIRMAK